MQRGAVTQRVVFQPDRTTLLLLLGIALAAGVTIFMLADYFYLINPYTNEPEQNPFLARLIVGTVVVPFIGFRVWWLSRQLLAEGVLILDAGGLTDLSYGLGYIPWSNIRAARLLRRARKQHNPLGMEWVLIELELRDEAAYFASASPMLRWGIQHGQPKGTAGFWINVRSIDAHPDDVLDAIRARL
jgi:hypothetical protein